MVAALLLFMLHVSSHLVGPAGVVVAIVVAWCLGRCFAASVAWTDAFVVGVSVACLAWADEELSSPRVCAPCPWF
jgi:predicted benzoate:H+ symporter BenE